MTNFVVGQRVCCVDDSRHPHCSAMPVQGRAYTIRALPRTSRGMVGIYLEEITNPIYPYADGDFEPAFRSNRFRPLVTKQTDISFAHEILRKTSRKQGADA